MRLFTVAVPELIKYQWLLPELGGKATRISSVLIVPNDGLESNVPDMNMDMLPATAPTSLVAVPPTAEYVKLGFASGTLNVIGFADAKWNGLATVSSWPKSLRRSLPLQNPQVAVATGVVGIDSVESRIALD